jgi:hypothetical protein
MDRLLTAEEIAERLGMRTDWVWAQARAGLITHPARPVSAFPRVRCRGLVA